MCLCCACAASLATAQPPEPQPAPANIVELRAGETKALTFKGIPGQLLVLELRLGGGLIHLQSEDVPRRLLDLGRGGQLHFAARVPASGDVRVDLASAERLRTAVVEVELLPATTMSDAQRTQLYAAGVDFARADSARRHLPHAPDATEALKVYERAAAEAMAAQEPNLARWALAQEARFLLYGKSSFVETRALLQHAAALPGKDDAATQALVYKTLSSCEYYLGDVAAATADGERALALYRQTEDRYWQGIVLSNLIPDYAELGRDTDAANAAREALTDAEETQDPAGVVFSLTELAGLYRRQGALQPAFQAFREAGRWAEDIRYAPLVQAQIEEAQGEFYMGFGLWAEAIQQLQEALLHTPADSPTALEARGMLASASAQAGDLPGSLREYGSALQAAQRLHLPAEEASLLLGRSAARLIAHQATAALEDARRARQIAQEQNSPSLRIEALLAEATACDQSSASHAEATSLYREALQQIEESGQRRQEAAAYAGLAQLHEKTGETRQALQEMDRALTLLEQTRASLASRDLAANLFAQGRSWYALATSLAVHLQAADPAGNFAEQAFRFAERARARAMLDALGRQSVIANGTTKPAEDALRLSAVRNRIEKEEGELLHAADAKPVSLRLHALYREQDSLEAELRQQHGELQLPGTIIADIAEVQHDLLDEQTALLVFAPGINESYRWVLTRSAQRVDTLPSAEIVSRTIASLREALVPGRQAPRAGEDASQYSHRMTLLRSRRDTLLARAGALLLPQLPASIHQLYIVADGDLAALPWAALRIRCAHGSSCYAVERFEIAMQPSASVALALRRRSSAAGAGTGTLVVSRPTPVASGANLHWASLQSLTGSGREADAILRLMAGGERRRLQGSQATVDGLRNAMRGDLALAHIAAHTVLVAAHPELSGVALSPPGSGDASAAAVLWLRDIPTLRSPPLVVLSGCATQGNGVAGEELNAVAQAFFYAGAQQVVASNWAVDDDATVPLMESFYRKLLQDRLPAAQALRQAQLRMIRRHAEIRDWAAFLLDGVPPRGTQLESAAR